MKLNRNGKIKIRIGHLACGKDYKGLHYFSKSIAETKFTRPELKKQELTLEQKEYLQLINLRMEELRLLMQEK